MSGDKSTYTKIAKDVETIWKNFSEQMETYLKNMSDENLGSYSKLHERWNDYRDKMIKDLNKATDAESADVLSDLFTRWLDFSNDFESFLKSMDDGGVYRDIYNSFEDYMENISGPIHETLSLSMKEQFKHQEDLYSRWVDSWAQLSSDEDNEINRLINELREKWSESSLKLSEELMRSVKEGDVQGLYRRMEREWMMAASEATQKLLLSRPYAMAQGTYIDNLLDSRITQKELMDNYLKSMGMPTREDMLKVYESLHELTSRIRKIERLLENLPQDK